MTTPIRYNHRFLLAPEVLPALKKAGLQVSAEAFIGAITDAIEDREHPFFIGMQGHPEQGSAGARPHPLLTAFLTAAMRMHSKA
jgi:CTP synthase